MLKYINPFDADFPASKYSFFILLLILALIVFATFSLDKEKTCKKPKETTDEDENKK